MTGECRPPEGTPDGTVCYLTNGGPHPMLVERIWSSLRGGMWMQRDPILWRPEGCLVVAAYGWRFHSIATPPSEAPDATVRISAVTLANLADAAETQIIGSYPNAILYPPQRKAMEAELAPVREAREALRAVTDCSTAAAPRRP